MLWEDFYLRYDLTADDDNEATFVGLNRHVATHCHQLAIILVLTCPVGDFPFCSRLRIALV